MKKTLLAAALLLGALTMSAQSYEHSLGVSVGNLFGVSYKGFFFGVEGLGMQIDLGCKLSNWGTHYSQNSSWEAGGESGSETTSYPLKDDKDPLSWNYFTFEVNPNIVYNLPVHSGSYGSLAFCAGGGVSLGLLKAGVAKNDVYRDENGNTKSFWWAISQTVDGPDGKEPRIDNQFKFGINALVGLELDLAAVPLVVGFDFRPGYGMGYRSQKQDFKGVTETSKTITNFFDWTLAASLRYKF